MAGQAADADDERLFPVIDRVFLVFIGLELLAFPLLPMLPVIVAAGASLTPMRASPRRMSVLWVLAGLLSVIVLAPFVLPLFELPTIQEGPVHTVG